MPAYKKASLVEFIQSSPSEIIGELESAYANDGFSSQYTRQTKAWVRLVPDLQESFSALLGLRPLASNWSILLEYPLYRLRRRIDIVILAGGLLLVVECKVGELTFKREDARQVEEYALDLRDFHAESHGRHIIPILWCTAARQVYDPPIDNSSAGSAVGVGCVIRVGSEGLTRFLSNIVIPSDTTALIADRWTNLVINLSPTLSRRQPTFSPDTALEA